MRRGILGGVLLTALSFTSVHAAPFTLLFNNFPVAGEHPAGGLTLVGSTLVGTTSAAFSSSNPPPFGRLFSLNLDGSNFQTLHEFAGPEGANSTAAPTLVGSMLYGTTSGRKAGQPATGNYGTVYSMNPDGSNYQVLHSFAGRSSDYGVASGSLIAVGSTLYGTEIGPNLRGAVFSINQDGSHFQTVHHFSGPDGGNPQAALTQVGSQLFGTGSTGGSNGFGVVFSMNVDGSNYQVLHNFAGNLTDGATPVGSLTAVGSTLFGTTRAGGASPSSLGTLFSMNLDGSNYQVLHSFLGPSGQDGDFPQSGLVQVASKLYGTARGLFSINTDGTNYQSIPLPQEMDLGIAQATPLAIGPILYLTNGGSTTQNGKVFSYATPEPSTFVSALIGLVGLLAWNWRRLPMNRAL